MYNKCFKGLQPQTPFIEPLPFINCFGPAASYGVTRSGLCHTILGIGPQKGADEDMYNFHRTSFLKDIILDKYDLHVRLHDPRTLQCVFTSKETKGTLWKIAKNIQYAAVKVLFYLGGCFTTYISNLVKVLRYEASTGKEAKVLYQKLGSLFLPHYARCHFEKLKTGEMHASWMSCGPKERVFVRCRILSGQLRGVGLSMVGGKMNDYVRLDWTEELFRQRIDDAEKRLSQSR